MKIKKNIALLLITGLMYAFIPIYALAEKSITDEETMFSYVKTDWWQGFDDAVLNEYIIKAVHNNFDLKLSTLKVEEATENKNIVRAGEMPSIGVGAVPALYKLPAITQSEGIISFPLYANYELDLFGKNRDKTKSMDKMIDISRQNERSSYISVVSAVGSTYYNIVKLDKLIEIQEEIVKERQEIYDLMKLSNDEGIISAADTVNAHKSLINSESDIIEFKKLREKMLNMLAVLIGDSPENADSYERIAYDDLVIKKLIPDFIPSEIIENRPDYISAEKMIEKAGFDVRAAKKEFLPSLNILGVISFNSTKYISKLNWTNASAILAGGVLLPLFTGGKRIANLKLNKNKYKQALENYQNINIKSIQEVNDSLCDLKLDNEKYIKSIENYEAEKQSLYYSKLKYKEGIISKLDFLQKQESLLVTEKMTVNNKTALFIDQIGLYKSTAGGI